MSDHFPVGILPHDTLSLAKAIRNPGAFRDGPVSSREVRREARRRLSARGFSVLAVRADMLRVIRQQVSVGQFDLARSNLRFLTRSRRPKEADLPVPAIP